MFGHTLAPWAALFIGMVAGWVYVGASKLLIKLKIDDAVDAIPVHFFNGIWGCIATGLLAEPYRTGIAYGQNVHVGWFYSWGNGSGDAALLLCEFLGVLFIIGWTMGIMAPFFMLLNFLGVFRVDPVEEMVGLDVSHHKGSAYDFNGPSAQEVEDFSASRSGKAATPEEET